MSDLASKTCVPCRGDVPAFESEAIAALLGQLDGWTVANGHDLNKTYSFPDFASALAFTNSVGAVAEAEGHHPDIFLTWGKVGIRIWTHKIDGLTESDFVLAAKIDALARA